MHRLKRPPNLHKIYVLGPQCSSQPASGPRETRAVGAHVRAAPRCRAPLIHSDGPIRVADEPHELGLREGAAATDARSGVRPPPSGPPGCAYRDATPGRHAEAPPCSAGTSATAATGAGGSAGRDSAATCDSLLMSIRQPVSRAASRAFWPSFPIASESW